MSLRSYNSDFYPSLQRSGEFGGKVLGTLVYIVKHDKIANILNDNELVGRIEMTTDFKILMGGNWERCKGELNLYQLDGPEGHRFVISLHWDKKWYKKLRKVYGVKISCVERHSLLEMLCLIEETRRLRAAYMLDTIDMMYPTDSSRREISAIQEEPENDEDDNFGTIKKKANSEENMADVITVKKSDESKPDKQLSEVHDEDHPKDSPDLPTKALEVLEKTLEVPAKALEVLTETDPNSTAVDSTEIPKVPDEFEESAVFESSTENSQEQSEMGRSFDSTDNSIKSSDAENSITVENEQQEAHKPVIPNGKIHTVEVHDDSSTPKPASKVKRPSKAFTIDEDLSGYDEPSLSSILNSRKSSTTSSNTNKPRGIYGSSDGITIDAKSKSSPQNQKQSFTKSLPHFDNPESTKRPNRKYETINSVIFDGPKSKPPSVLARLFARMKRNKSKTQSLKTPNNQSMSSRLALHETSSLKSAVSYDAMSLTSFGTLKESTYTLQGTRHYDRKFFKRRPASMHVLTRDRRLVPIYDVINCLLEFHDVMKPVKIIGVNSETPHSEDLAENQIMEFVYFLQKPVNLELRLTRKDYVLYNSVVKLRSFSSTELKILLA